MMNRHQEIEIHDTLKSELVKLDTFMNDHLNQDGLLASVLKDFIEAASHLTLEEFCCAYL